MGTVNISNADALRRAEQLVGLPFIPGRFDCVHLAVRAQWEVFGRRVGWNARRHPIDAAERAEVLRGHRDTVADPVPADQARTGDVLLFLLPGDRYHVGTYFWHQRPWLLHVQTLGTTSRLEPLEQACIGMRLDGVYRWREQPQEHAA